MEGVGRLGEVLQLGGGDEIADLGDVHSGLLLITYGYIDCPPESSAPAGKQGRGPGASGDSLGFFAKYTPPVFSIIRPFI